jgi:hypothetical protein
MKSFCMGPQTQVLRAPCFSGFRNLVFRHLVGSPYIIVTDINAPSPSGIRTHDPSVRAAEHSRRPSPAIQRTLRSLAFGLSSVACHIQSISDHFAGLVACQHASLEQHVMQWDNVCTDGGEWSVTVPFLSAHMRS